MCGMQVGVRPAFARKLAGFPAGRTAVQPLRNGKRNGAANGAKQGAADDGSTAGRSGRAAAVGDVAVVSMGCGLVAAVIRLAGSGEHAAAQLAAGSNGGEALLLGPASSPRKGPRHAAAEAKDEQQDGQAAASADTGGVRGLVVKAKPQKKRIRAQEDAGAIDLSPAAGSRSRSCAETLLRVTVFEEAYGCVQGLHEAALDAPENGRVQDAAASGRLQVSCCSGLSPILQGLCVIPNSVCFLLAIAACLRCCRLGLQAVRLGSKGQLAVATPVGVLLWSAHAQPASLASLVGALSLHPSSSRNPAAQLQRRALHPAQLALAAGGPAHSHFQPAWAQRGAAAGLPWEEHAGQIGVPLGPEHLERCAFHLCRFFRVRAAWPQGSPMQRGAGILQRNITRGVDWQVGACGRQRHKNRAL